MIDPDDYDEDWDEEDEHGHVYTISDSLLSQPMTSIPLPRISARSGVLQLATVAVLLSYGKLLAEYDITNPDQVRVVATSAVREATNRLEFLDRVYVATGLEIEAIDEAEVNRITYLGVQPLIENHPALGDAQSIVIEVGGGSTEILLVQAGENAGDRFVQVDGPFFQRLLVDVLRAHVPACSVDQAVDR